jgi:pilus assembly protein CpaB
MTTRIIAVILAAVLAVVGAVLLVGYVRGADQRAFEGAKLTQVLIVQDQVGAGTSGDSLGSAVSLESIPEAYVADGAVTDVKTLKGLVASVALEPGEQVLASRFVKPGDFGASGGTVPIPKGMQQLSLAIDLQRVVGGNLAAGDLVGVFASLAAEGDAAASTQLVDSKVLVTGVATGQAADSNNAAPTQGTVVVTLAVTGDQAKQIVYALEFGHVWLSQQNGDTTAPAVGAVTRGSFVG